MALNSEDTKKRKGKNIQNAFNKKKKKDRKVPCAEEIESFREVESSYHSGLFKMQIDELFKELKKKISEKDKLEQWIEKFESLLLSIPESEQCMINQFSLDSSIKIPVSCVPENNKGIFKFISPTVIKKIGSYSLDTVCSSEPVVDIAVEIPKACWQKGDFLNHRYLRKRAFYLTYIANFLLGTDLVSNMKFSYLNDCCLKPVLLLYPTGIDSLTVSLTAYPEKGVFKLNRFIPMRNNVRSSWLHKTENDEDVPTPNYNSIILSDVLLPNLDELLKKNILTQNVKDGLLLIKLWGYRRGLLKGYGRLNGFILTLFVVHLIKTQKINDLMNPYQVFRSTLLSFRDLSEGDVILIDGAENSSCLEDFQKFFKFVFVESSGFLNVCYSVSLETILRLKHEAKLSLQMLDTESPDVFQTLFMNHITFYNKFEYILVLQGKKFEEYVQHFDLKNEELDFPKDKVSCIIPKICSILKKGLNKRISLLDVKKTCANSWLVSEYPPHPNSCVIILGFLLNAEIPLNNLEKGPLSDDPQAKDFREFWGKRSNLRLFQDQTIREAVLWEAETIADKRKVFKRIIDDIFERHIISGKDWKKVEKKTVKSERNVNYCVRGCEMDSVLQVPQLLLSPKFTAYGTGEEHQLILMQSFSSLSKQLRNLDDLPLAISSVQGVSPSFRFTEVFPPLSRSHNPANAAVLPEQIHKLKQNVCGVPPYVHALKIVVSFEGTGKWPDDLEAIRKLKTAFYIKIAKSIKLKHGLVAVPFLSHVDILKDGFVFRLELSCHKEIFLLKQIRMPNGMIKMQESDESKHLEVAVEIKPKLTSLLHGLHQQHNTFGTACRIAKRWISSQMLQDFFSDEAVDLLVAYLYINPQPYTCPSLPQVAFLRFLSLLVSFDWNSNPLFVNLNNEIPAEEIRLVSSCFHNVRPTLPSMIIVTPLDRVGNMWTKTGPPDLILKRIQGLAESGLEVFERGLYHFQTELYFETIFKPQTKDFDVIIYMKRLEMPNLCYSLEPELFDILPCFLPHTLDVNEKYPVVDYDPVKKYVDELKANFGEFAFFFYDKYGGDTIGVLWKKTAFAPKELKISHAAYRTTYDSGYVMPDMEAILEDIQTLGSKLVSRVVRK